MFSKTEVILVSSLHQVKANPTTSIFLVMSSIVTNLGVKLDPELNLKDHNDLAKTLYFPSHDLWGQDPHLNSDTHL